MERSEHTGGPGASLSRVLVVEDDPDILRMLITVLRAADVQTDEALCGADAIRKLEAEDPGCLVVDWNLIDMNALELLEEAERLHPGSRARTLVITGDLIQRDEKHAAEDLGVPVLNKPFRPAELVALVRQLLSA